MQLSLDICTVKDWNNLWNPLTYCMLCVPFSCKTSVGESSTYHGQSEWVDASDIQEAVLPGDEALSVDVQLIPDWQDGLVVLLVPTGSTKAKFKPFLTTTRLIGVFASYLLARLMLSGLGGGTIRHTEGTVISSPPGPVMSHLLRLLLFFRIASLSLQIVFCRSQKQN